MKFRVPYPPTWVGFTNLRPETILVARKDGAMQLLILLIWFTAIFVIFYAFFRALTLKRQIPGGLVKQSWKLLYYLIGLLGVGYLTMPLFPRLPESSRDFIVAIVSLAGAIFIVKVINLFFKIIKEVGL